MRIALQPIAGAALALAGCFHAAAMAQEDPPGKTPATEAEKPALPAQTELSDWSYKLKNVATVGIGVRTEAQRSTLAPGGSSNSDDGNLNYAKGDTFSRIGKLHSHLDVTHGSGFGFTLAGMAWYDQAQEKDSVPHGNNPNGYIPNTPLSDDGFSRAAKFSGVQLLNASVHGETAELGGKLQWRLGKLSVERERGFSFNGGLRDLETRNSAASGRPGAQADEDVIPIWALAGRWNVTQALRFDAFLQFAHERSIASGCGSFLSSNDYAQEGCNRVFYSSVLPEQANVARGIFTPRSADIEPADKPDQFGIGASYLAREIGTRFGIYAAKYHSRQGFTDVRKGSALGPAGGSTYAIEYPKDKRMVALTSATRIPDLGLALLNEISITSGQPVQLNTTDLQTAFLAGQGPLGRDAIATPANALYHGYDRFRVVQAQTGALKEFKDFLGAETAFLGAEAGIKHVVGLPDVARRRYGRPEGAAVCATPADCATNDGYVTANAWAYRIRAGLNYANVGGTGVRLRPSITFGHDVKGWSFDYGFIEGRKSVRVALDVDFSPAVFANLSYVTSRGGQFNPRKDMDFAMASVGIKF